MEKNEKKTTRNSRETHKQEKTNRDGETWLYSGKKEGLESLEGLEFLENWDSLEGLEFLEFLLN